MKKLLYNDKLTITYLRLSLADGDDKDESNSITSQRKIASDFCKREMPGEETYELVDDGYSGTNFNRPSMLKLLKLVREEKVKTIIVKDLSRFGRDYLDVGYYLEYFFPLYQVRFISIDDQFDSDKFNSSMKTMEVAIKSLLNDRYSKDISRKIISSVHLKKMAGEYCYGAVPFGYKKGEVKNTIIIDDEAAKIVRYIFNLALEGNKIAQIARTLNEEKVCTPSKYLSSIRKNYRVVEQWTYESVRNILTNRIYTGDTEAYKSHVKKVGSDAVKVIPEADREVIKNTHERIISREEFELARNVITKTKPKTKSDKEISNSILTGKLVCGCCGNRLFKGKAKNKSFLCTNRRYVQYGVCKEIRVDEEEMVRVLKNAIQAQLAMLAEQEKEKEYQIRRQANVQRVITDSSEKLEKKKKSLMDEKMKLYESYVSGEISKEEYLTCKEVLDSKLQKLSEEEAGLEEEKKSLESVKAKEPVMDVSKLKIHGATFDMTAEFIDSVIEQVVVNGNKEWEIVWKYKDGVEEGKILEFVS